MGIKVAVIFSVFFILVDLVITTVLYTHGSNLTVFKKDVQNFNILLSVLDLWGIVVLRDSLVLGASMGVLWNGDDGPRRVSKLTTLILFICMSIFTYALAKLLLLSELQNLAHQPWILSLICWTCASCVGVVLVWSLLGKESNSTSSSGSSGRGSEGTEQLVETANGEEQEVGCGEQKKRLIGEGSQEKETSSGATLGRLLSYCRKDSGLLSVAILFLIISAVCESP